MPILAGEGEAFRKRDGTACLVRAGELFKRYDSKLDKRGQRKAQPPGWEACEPAPDEQTGHWPGWLPVDDDPQSKWHAAAWLAAGCGLADGTYELCGPHFSANPERFPEDTFVAHNAEPLGDVPREFDGLRAWLADHEMEGIVFHHPAGWMTKLRRADFGLPWPILSSVAP